MSRSQPSGCLPVVAMILAISAAALLAQAYGPTLVGNFMGVRSEDSSSVGASVESQRANPRFIHLARVGQGLAGTCPGLTHPKTPVAMHWICRVAAAGQKPVSVSVQGVSRGARGGVV